MYCGFCEKAGPRLPVIVGDIFAAGNILDLQVVVFFDRANVLCRVVS